MLEKIGIGQLGYGGIGKVHTLAYRSIPHYYPNVLPQLRLAAVCTSSKETASRAKEAGGFARAYTSMEELAADPDVTVIDCSLPNGAHREAIRIALEAGKHIYCEKPLAVDAADAREIERIARGAAPRIGMTFHYRFVPAVTKAKQLIEADALGEIYNFQMLYLHTGYQNESRPLSWRMDREQSGGGALVDLGSHIIDLTRFLLGDFARVFATSRTFIKERPVSKGASQMGPVTVDDAMWMQAELEDGAMGTLEVSRFATGSLDDLIFRIEGRKGALKFSLMEGNWLWWYDASGKRSSADEGWTRMDTAASFSGATIPPGRSILGWPRIHAENQFQFLKSIVEGREPEPGLHDGIATQLIMQAAYDSAASGSWVDVPR